MICLSSFWSPWDGRALRPEKTQTPTPPAGASVSLTRARRPHVALGIRSNANVEAGQSPLRAPYPSLHRPGDAPRPWPPSSLVPCARPLCPVCQAGCPARTPASVQIMGSLQPACPRAPGWEFTPPHDLSVLSIPRIALLSFPAGPAFAFRHPHPPAVVRRTLQRSRLTPRVRGRPHQPSADETGAPPGDDPMPRCRISLK
jgi:hypothetical protein